MSTPQNEMLKRSLGMREAVTITVGTVVGVGLFTTGAQIVGSMGSAVILATFMAMVISVYPAHLYAEMSAALPFAGGTYKYAQLGLGKAAGMLAGWNFIASLVAVTSGEALAFSFYFKMLFQAFGVELPISDVLLASIPIVLFIVTNIRGTEMTGRLQNGFMFFFWGVAIIWALMMIPNIHLPSYVVLPESMNNLSSWSFIGMVAMIWWCFAGFETCCALGEEIKHPRINLPRALKLFSQSTPSSSGSLSASSRPSISVSWQRLPPRSRTAWPWLAFSVFRWRFLLRASLSAETSPH